jgi:ABC-type phosphate/phosphonate transport system substrate-binding protein
VNDLRLMVCPHDAVRNPGGWRHLVRYLSARLDSQIDFAAALDFTDFHQRMAQADVVYASATDALRLIDGGGFCAVARPAGIYDEALLVAGPDGPLPAVEALHGAAVASVEHLLPTRLALTMLRERGIVPASLAHRDSWLSVVRSVWNGEVPFGILYRDAYNGLSPQGREMVRVLEATDGRSAFHLIAARADLGEGLAALAGALAAMPAHPAGVSALADLHTPAWLPVTDDDIARLRAACT